MEKCYAAMYEMEKKGKRWIKGRNLAERDDFKSLMEANTSMLGVMKGWMMESFKSEIHIGITNSRYVCSRKGAGGREERRLILITSEKT